MNWGIEMYHCAETFLPFLKILFTIFGALIAIWFTAWFWVWQNTKLIFWKRKMGAYEKIDEYLYIMRLTIANIFQLISFEFIKDENELRENVLHENYNDFNEAYAKLKQITHTKTIFISEEGLSILGKISEKINIEFRFDKSSQLLQEKIKNLHTAIITLHREIKKEMAKDLRDTIMSIFGKKFFNIKKEN